MAIEFIIPDPSTSPPGGWEYKFPSTQHTVKHFDWQTFRKQYESHSLANNIPLPPEWEADLHDVLCKQNGAKWAGVCQRAGDRQTINPLNFGTMMSFLKVMASWAKDVVAGGEGFVAQETAEMRAGICSTCPYNMTMATGCGACTVAVSRGVEAIISGKTTQYDKILEGKACGLCGCALRAAIWVPLEPQVAAMSETVKDKFRAVKSFCWKAQTIE